MRSRSILLSFVMAIAVSSAVVTASAETPAGQLQAKLAPVQSLQGRFVQTIYEQDDPVQQLSGSFALQRPALLRWETEEPEQTLLIADGDTLWYYNPFIEQVSLFDQAETMQTNPLLVLLTNDEWTGFEVSFSDDLWHIRETNGGFHQVLSIGFNEQGYLNTMALDDGQGQRSVFRLQNLEVNSEIERARFQFEIPSGTDIDDQRQRQ
ncbi:MAG: outer membrane lipoprotein chaperone LolA [Idiomarina sp.]|nr:outer membrane lipoprotein chaperone LolA [Idiomarina sp.]